MKSVVDRTFVPGLLVITVLAVLIFSAGCAMPAGSPNGTDVPGLYAESRLMISRYEHSGNTVNVTGMLYLNLANPGSREVRSVRPCVYIVPIHPVDTGVYQKEYCYPLSDIPPGTSINLTQPVNLSLPESTLLEIQNDQTGVNLIVKVPGYAVSGHP
jgi:hypothetical protein